MLKKLRMKFILVNMGIVASMLLVILGMLYHFTKEDLEAQSVAALQTLSQKMQQPEKREPESVNVQMPWFVIKIGFMGDVSTAGNTYFELTDEVLLQELIEIALPSLGKIGFSDAYGLMYTSVPYPSGRYLVFVDTSVQSAALKAQIRISVVIGIFALILFAGISILLAWWAIKPVERAWQQQKQFVSDASHELKTPLTVIMSNAELLQNSDCSEEARRRFSGNILTMSYQMRSLVEGLLELVRVENGQVRKNFSRVGFSKLVSDALLPFEPVLFEKGLIIEESIEPDIILTGSAQHLQQVVDILLDNAGKYADSGIVTVSLQRQGRNQCLLTISNPGQPIAQEELEQIFERFYRTDRARSRTGSFGLGLAIAKAVTQEHNGKIWAESNAFGNRFCVLLPCELK